MGPVIDDSGRGLSTSEANEPVPAALSSPSMLDDFSAANTSVRRKSGLEHCVIHGCMEITDEEAVAQIANRRVRRERRNGEIAAAGIDVTDPEPLPPSSELWGIENVILTPHTGGETRLYEDNVLDILIENIQRLERGETDLLNQIV